MATLRRGRAAAVRPPGRNATSKSSPSSRLPRAGLSARRPGAPGGKRDTNRKERAETISRSGLRLFLERGVDSVTIDDIVGAAGIAKGSFYRYFADKGALVEAIVAPLRASYASAIDATEQSLREARDASELSRAYEGLALALLPVALLYPGAIRFYLQESRGPGVGPRAPIRALSDQIAESAVRLTGTAVERGLLRVDDPRVSAFAVVGAIEHLVLAVIQGRLEIPPQRIVATLIKLVLEGLRPR
jgi:AcrR family transcriptional regulator